jgi:uncharacterized membrane protein
MKEKIHEQISSELKQASYNDATMTIIAVIVTLAFLGLALGFAFSTTQYGMYGDGSIKVHTTVIMFISLITAIIVNCFSIIALFNNNKRKIQLTESLLKLYQEEGLQQYYDNTGLKVYKARRNIFTTILATIGAAGTIIPLVVFIHQIMVDIF